ncbi:MAG: hypothetical protein ACTMUB_03365 [cyanobacterium endosymbiont of Rhopalodia musculus]|uniref:hypothetical protein n=1 Tax=cyanobacterium endosymbiont of Epithemia clementina EcSB TaxID=3034674 RepID=UPI002481454F|nr:hypothetical protein [cyanobacterium endosymbiont of Epithemia clementina EcSB]WGT67241.1 hypothetical protein P3F56_08520 [cyanobacterium endosymbiont of Epithemia clementina EcSB]
MTVLSQKRWRKRGLWLMGSTGLTFMVAWDWKLVLATTTGVLVMVLIYQIQGGNWQRRWSYYREFLKGFSGKLILAVSSGGLGAIVAYIAASVWANAENRWLAIGCITQGIGTLFSLGLLLWQIVQVREKSYENQFNQWILDLTSADPLKRLIAVQSLANFLKKQWFNPHYHQQLRDYFELMLTKETESLVRQGILEGLATCNEQQVPNLSKDTKISLKQELKIHEL